MTIWEEIENLEKSKNDLVAEQAAKGDDKWEVLGWFQYKRNLETIQDRLDELYDLAMEGE